MPDRDSLTVTDRLAAASGPGPVWTQTSADRNVNLLVVEAGRGAPAQVNQAVAVLIVCVAGAGVVEVADATRPLRAGQALGIPKGVSRALRSAGGPFAYLTCHRRRGGLMPA